MIIGISGKIGSGKDTVGHLIRHLVAVDMKVASNAEHAEICLKILKKTGFLPIQSVQETGWEIKKFAGKLKQIVALLTGCSIEALEDQNFKNSKLPKEWNQEGIIFGSIETNFESPGTEQVSMTYREMLQKVGTEAMRDKVHTNIWCNALFADYKKPAQLAIERTGGYTNSESPMDFPNWIITDMRFPNEMAAVKERGGITIRVNRKWVTRKMSFGNITETRHIPGFDAPEHPSETALDDAKFDYVIENHGTLEELIEKVKEILIKEGIIK